MVEKAIGAIFINREYRGIYKKSLAKRKRGRRGAARVAELSLLSLPWVKVGGWVVVGAGVVLSTPPFCSQKFWMSLWMRSRSIMGVVRPGTSSALRLKRFSGCAVRIWA